MFNFMSVSLCLCILFLFKNTKSFVKPPINIEDDIIAMPTSSEPTKAPSPANYLPPKFNLTSSFNAFYYYWEAFNRGVITNYDEWEPGTLQWSYNKTSNILYYHYIFDMTNINLYQYIKLPKNSDESTVIYMWNHTTMNECTKWEIPNFHYTQDFFNNSVYVGLNNDPGINYIRLNSGYMPNIFEMFMDAVNINGTLSPTESPTLSPTIPTSLPTDNPSLSPSVPPTDSPTLSTLPPSLPPTVSTLPPTNNPTLSPTESPTLAPSVSPTNSTQSPTSNTSSPTKSPVVTPDPTKSPTILTAVPTNTTLAPTNATLPPTNATSAPTNSTLAPTPSTLPPTQTPTVSPTNATLSPTNSTLPPTNSTQSPTKNPTNSPTHNPSKTPTRSPTRSPTEFSLYPSPVEGLWTGQLPLKDYMGKDYIYIVTAAPDGYLGRMQIIPESATYKGNIGSQVSWLKNITYDYSGDHSNYILPTACNEYPIIPTIQPTSPPEPLEDKCKIPAVMEWVYGLMIALTIIVILCWYTTKNNLLSKLIDPSDMNDELTQFNGGNYINNNNNNKNRYNNNGYNTYKKSNFMRGSRGSRRKRLESGDAYQMMDDNDYTNDENSIDKRSNINDIPSQISINNNSNNTDKQSMLLHTNNNNNNNKISDDEYMA